MFTELTVIPAACKYTRLTVARLTWLYRIAVIGNRSKRRPTAGGAGSKSCGNSLGTVVA